MVLDFIYCKKYSSINYLDLNKILFYDIFVVEKQQLFIAGLFICYARIYLLEIYYKLKH